MKTYQRQLVPQDVLFLRDARPMEASDAGCGANWPRPDQLWNALIHQMHRLWPERQTWEGEAHRKRQEEQGGNRHSSDRFGALQTVGPFPLYKNMVFFPCPLDLSGGEDAPLQPMQLVPGVGTDLPKPLKYAFSNTVLGKQTLPAWISREEYLQYLKGESFQVEKIPLYDVERNIGIAIDSETGTAKEGQIYQAEYLRLREGVGLAFLASCEIKPKGGSGLVDVLEKISLPSSLIIGGQQGISHMLPSAWKLPGVPMPALDEKPLLLRWTLLSPAIFPKIEADASRNLTGHPGGWLPSWVDPQTGNVMLPKPTQDSQRRPGESREAWRERRRNQGNIEAKLIAARTGKPLFFSGWDLHQKTDQTEQISQGAKATQAAVPAGSTYVFECQTPAAFKELWQALDAQGSDNRIVRRSANFGEKGFGIGVCSVFPTPKN
jgi:CRISPR type III-B/RAMP module-associated protein Cmr3